MILDTLADIVLIFYNEGRNSASVRTFDKRDMMQYLRIAASDIMRTLYLQNKKLNEGEEYYFLSPLFSIKRFSLTDPDATGMRRADISGNDFYRMPKNAHITNIYPIGDGCIGSDGEITLSQVQPGEENFYTKPKYQFFKFYVIKGKGINTYHLPSCIKSIDMEATFDNDNVDISLDVAFRAANQVLATALHVPGFYAKQVDNSYSPQQILLSKRVNPSPQETPME